MIDLVPWKMVKWSKSTKYENYVSSNCFHKTQYYVPKENYARNCASTIRLKSSWCLAGAHQMGSCAWSSQSQSVSHAQTGLLWGSIQNFDSYSRPFHVGVPLPSISVIRSGQVYFVLNSWARSFQPKFRPVRPGEVVHLKRWTSFFRNFSGWTEPIHWVLDQNFRKFWLNGSYPIFIYILHHWKINSTINFLECKT